MVLTDAEVDAVVNDPYLTYPADSRHGPDRTMHVRDRVCCVVGSDRTVITFGWSGQETGYEPWTRPSHPGSVDHASKQSRLPACTVPDRVDGVRYLTNRKAAANARSVTIGQTTLALIIK